MQLAVLALMTGSCFTDLWSMLHPSITSGDIYFALFFIVFLSHGHFLNSGSVGCWGNWLSVEPYLKVTLLQRTPQKVLAVT